MISDGNLLGILLGLNDGKFDGFGFSVLGDPLGDTLAKSVGK